eukprot:scaffold10079_cov61-Phaeocystis_antarctica.AAC.1
MGVIPRNTKPRARLLTSDIRLLTRARQCPSPPNLCRATRPARRTSPPPPRSLADAWRTEPDDDLRDDYARHALTASVDNMCRAAAACPASCTYLRRRAAGPEGATTARAARATSMYRAPWHHRRRQPVRGALVQSDRPGGLPAAERAARPRRLGHLCVRLPRRLVADAASAA